MTHTSREYDTIESKTRDELEKIGRRYKNLIEEQRREFDLVGSFSIPTDRIVGWQQTISAICSTIDEIDRNLGEGPGPERIDLNRRSLWILTGEGADRFDENAQDVAEANAAGRALEAAIAPVELGEK